MSDEPDRGPLLGGLEAANQRSVDPLIKAETSNHISGRLDALGGSIAGRDSAPQSSPATAAPSPQTPNATATASTSPSSEGAKVGDA